MKLTITFFRNNEHQFCFFFIAGLVIAIKNFYFSVLLFLINPLVLRTGGHRKIGKRLFDFANSCFYIALQYFPFHLFFLAFR